MENAKSMESGFLDRLLNGVARGRADDLEALYRALQRPVFLLALSMLHDYSAAEDVTQETFIRVNKSAASCRKDTNAKAWIFTIARNLCLNRLKAQKPAELSENTPDHGPELEERIASAIDFERMIAPLSETERQVIVLRFSGGLKHTQTAKLLGLSHNNVRAVYSRALKKLRKNLQGPAASIRKG
jgi:RNA polymerase sigma-70 factor, ECF subfamily